MKCNNMACVKTAGYTITSAPNTVVVCPSHVKWAIDQLLSNGGAFHIERYRPAPPTRDTVYLSATIKVDRKSWEADFGTSPHGLSEDVKDAVRTELQAGNYSEFYKEVTVR